MLKTLDILQTIAFLLGAYSFMAGLVTLDIWFFVIFALLVAIFIAAGWLKEKECKRESCSTRSSSPGSEPGVLG